MDPVSFRKREGWTQEQFAERLGVRSKGYISRLEAGTQPWPLRLALRLERLSAGVVVAASICEAAADLQRVSTPLPSTEARP
jgi:transcriptional regulator with XRE-family HTH domain